MTFGVFILVWFVPAVFTAGLYCGKHGDDNVPIFVVFLWPYDLGKFIGGCLK